MNLDKRLTEAAKRVKELEKVAEQAREALRQWEPACPGCGERHLMGHADSCACDHCPVVEAALDRARAAPERACDGLDIAEKMAKHIAKSETEHLLSGVACERCETLTRLWKAWKGVST